MSVANFLRNNLTSLPYCLGKLLAYWPFRYRPGIGRIYQHQKRQIKQFELLSSHQKKMWILEKFKNIVEYAYNNVEFYYDFYNSQRFHPEQLKTFEDIKKIPIINKKILQNYSIHIRTADAKSKQLVNTGGSSGKPLSFFVSPDQMGTEWAHIHTIWETLGFRPQNLKISLGGDSEIKNAFRYDAVRHSLWFNIYADFNSIKEELLEFLRKHRVSYLHGYPSALYEFSLNCQKFAELLRLLRIQLNGIFLSSEFPNPLYRKTIEDVFQVKTVSWYGHTERCILAYEKNRPYEYVPFHTYGYTELESTSSNNPSLIGTSYYNFASPLIRYDTDDQVTRFSLENGLLRSFEINEGRGGQFIVDINGKNIPLTGLIFGRHHKLFDHCSHIQICQIKKGCATILFVPKENSIGITPDGLFDSKNVAIKFDYIAIKEPIRTISGKINLLIRPEQLLAILKIDIE